jgi:hypothetical protein
LIPKGSDNGVRVTLTSQNYLIIGLCPSSGILEAIKHNVSETGSVSVLKLGETSTLLGPLERANLNYLMTETDPVSGTLYFLVTEVSSLEGLNRAGVSRHLRAEAEPLSGTLCFIASRIPDDGQSSNAQ